MIQTNRIGRATRIVEGYFLWADSTSHISFTSLLCAVRQKRYCMSILCMNKTFLSYFLQVYHLSHEKRQIVLSTEIAYSDFYMVCREMSTYEYM